MKHSLEQLRRGELQGTRRLNLAGGLSEFPREIFSLADSLEILDLSGNRLSSLPADLPRLGKLRILFCSDNEFTELPEVLGQCPGLTMVGFKANRIGRVGPEALSPGLRWLILTDNRIEALPDRIGHCGQLQKLMLAGNRLRTLPPTLAACTNLELLRLAANELHELPDWLLSLPRLSWLAYGGNPLCAAHELAAVAETPIPAVPWDELQIHQPLGEGASGVIHRAEQHRGEGPRPAAVKLFKGAVTSDGLPRSEMAACFAAGAHPSLIPLLGKVTDHPAGTQGLVMPLIDGEFANLAGPPSLDSCTRDIYAPAARFAPESLQALARNVASAAGHLHRRGIMHGDLYGHNILHGGRGRILLGDFGAASLFTPGTPHAQALQRLEVRAFGVLLEELLARCAAPSAASQWSAELAALAAVCLDPQPAARPLFVDIEARLAGLAAPSPGRPA